MRSAGSRVLFALALLLAAPVSAQDANRPIDVSVDRREVARGETLNFTIRVYDQRQGGQLDLTPLTGTFDLLGTRTSSQIRSVNGAVESWTDYIVTLFPLSEGELTIPSLDINGQRTDPITVSVTNEGPRSNQSSDELFLELEVNKETVYVQEQLLFTVRLYYTINGIRNPWFTELEMPDTVVQLIGSPNQYENVIDGVRYGVYEKRYVIFPQRSGPLRIPDILFRGEVTDGSSSFVFRNLNTRRVTAFIDGMTIQVAERPAAADSAFWLPVANLELRESWNRDLADLQVGDSLVRTVTMVADGLDGAVLPPFSTRQIDGLNLYPEPPDIQRTFVGGSIVGTRVEATTLVPVTSGEIEIPAITIPWWNVVTDSPETAVLPATRLNIADITGDVPAEQTVASNASIEELLASAPVLEQDAIDAQARADLLEVDASWLNYLIVAVAIIAAVGLYGSVLAPHRRRLQTFLGERSSRFIARYTPANNEQVAYRRLLGACRGSDVKRIRDSLIRWCNHWMVSRPVLTMEDILQQREAPELHPFVNRIQWELYNLGNGGERDEPLDGRELARLVSELRRERIRARRWRRRRQRYALPPLYRTTLSPEGR